MNGAQNKNLAMSTERAARRSAKLPQPELPVRLTPNTRVQGAPQRRVWRIALRMLEARPKGSCNARRGAPLEPVVGRHAHLRSILWVIFQLRNELARLQHLKPGTRTPNEHNQVAGVT